MSAPLGKMAEMLKNPKVLIGGLLLGVVVLIMLSRGKSSGGTPADSTLASQQIASNTNVQLAGFQTDYNKAALAFFGQKAQLAADVHAADLTANTSITLQAMSQFDNAQTIAGQLSALRANIGGSVRVNAQNNAAMLDAAGIQSDLTKYVTANQSATYLAATDTQAATQVALARITADSATTLANIQTAQQGQAQKWAFISQTGKGMQDAGMKFTPGG